MSCSAARQEFSVVKKYPAQELREDYHLLKEILEAKHPSLYWYTQKDSMDFFFRKYAQQIGDSMTEQQYAWHVLSPLVDKIKCGHTSVGASIAYERWARKKRFPGFPLFMKIWNDSMVVMLNLHRDSVIKKGTIVTSVNGLRTRELIAKMFDYLPQDGEANSNNYIRLSANFPYYHRNIFGLTKAYHITYLDSIGAEKSGILPLYVPRKDSAVRATTKDTALLKTSKHSRRSRFRTLEYDSSGKFATMTLNSFSKGNLRRFFRQSFRELREKNISNLILDIRYNGGGRIGLSTLLTKYVSRIPFKVADSLYATSKNLAPYTRYIEGRTLNNLELFFVARRKSDGKYHLLYLEKKLFYPKKRNHYNGKLYVIIGGPTFSASSLFCNAVKGQPGIVLTGEETGGGWHGNNGIMIPDIILPHTGVRVRLPLFRLVQYNHVQKNGTGVVPDMHIPPHYDALMGGYDKKMQVVKDLIRQK